MTEQISSGSSHGKRHMSRREIKKLQENLKKNYERLIPLKKQAEKKHKEEEKKAEDLLISHLANNK
ncbi:MAG TPA: hypothetical protein PKD96_00260 [Candidatus Absconditabacterales bacterium]|nr:hypothetical protein [Candidatus Absconditabacterales bacterium]